MSQDFTRTDTSAYSPTAARDTRRFTVQLSATRKGARLARLLAVDQLHSWGIALESPELVVAELAANAALHGARTGTGLPSRSDRYRRRGADDHAPYRGAPCPRGAAARGSTP
jgi:hypothetical protein